MKNLLSIFLLLLPIITKAQMLVYTVAGSDTATGLNDGGPATCAGLGSTEGIWLDGSCNLYITNLGNNSIAKVTASTGIIATIAGNGSRGVSSGDGGQATAAQLYNPYGLFADVMGNVYFAEIGSNRVRRIDATTGTITTFAGNGTAGYSGEGIPATNAQLNDPGNVYGDNAGNIYIGELGSIKKVNAAGIITTIAGTGTVGYSGDMGPATNAQLAGALGMMFDVNGNFFFADRGNSIIRKINPEGIISTFAGTPGVLGYSGDGGLATAAQLSGPISFVIDYLGNMVIGDNQNNYLRKVEGSTGIITTIGGMGAYGSLADGIPATAAQIHPEFMYLDRSGNIYFSDYGNNVRKVINYYPGELYGANGCGETAVPIVQPASNKVEIYPNPASNEVTIIATDKIESVEVLNLIGQYVYKQSYSNVNNAGIPISNFASGVYFVKVNGVYAGKFVKE